MTTVRNALTASILLMLAAGTASAQTAGQTAGQATGQPPAAASMPPAAAAPGAHRQAGALAACRSALQTLCADVEKGGGRKVKCLKDNEAKLTPECKTALATADAKRAERKAARSAAGAAAAQPAPAAPAPATPAPQK